MAFKVLIVEDDPAIRRRVEKLLIRHHVEIDTASEGRTAIDKMRHEQLCEEGDV